MAVLTSAQAVIVNKMNPAAEKVALGTSLKESQDYQVVGFSYTVAADATGNPTAFTAPFAMRIVDVIVQATATSASGTILPYKNGTGAMCTAIACATDGAVTHMSAGTTTEANLVLAAADTVTVDANGANDRGIVTFIAVRV